MSSAPDQAHKRQATANLSGADVRQAPEVVDVIPIWRDVNAWGVVARLPERSWPGVQMF